MFGDNSNSNPKPYKPKEIPMDPSLSGSESLQSSLRFRAPPKSDKNNQNNKKRRAIIMVIIKMREL